MKTEFETWLANGIKMTFSLSPSFQGRWLEELEDIHSSAIFLIDSLPYIYPHQKNKFIMPASTYKH